MEHLRKQYTRDGLQESDLDPCPFEQFGRWFAEAQREIKDDWFEPNAMALATANCAGEVSNRIVLLKRYDQNGFLFFTNYESRKGLDLAENPRASLLFFWPQMERQIRINGDVTKTDREISKKYFDSRPRKSRISASISPQSQPVKDRQSLELASQEELQKVGEEGEIDLPNFWGGYCLSPVSFEFWQGRENRLHDRLQYEWTENRWTIHRLGP